MKRFLVIAAIFLSACGSERVKAQSPTPTYPQTWQGVVMNAVTAATTTNTTPCGATNKAPAGSTCQIQNLGQVVHVVTYTTSVPANVTRVVIRLDGGWDGINFVPISDDATGLASGAVVAISNYPVIRLNLVEFAASGGATLSANYSGSSATSGPLYGVFNPSQGLQKTVVVGASMGTTQNFTVTCPTGFSLGYVFAVSQSGVNFVTGSTIAVAPVVQGISGPALSPLMSLTGLGSTGPAILAVPSQPASQVQVSFVSGGASANLYDVVYIFVPAGMPVGISAPGLQPIAFGFATLNSENVSSTNAAKTVIYGPFSGARVNLFSVNARCSAGTASLVVLDGATQIWSTAATEVGTTTFKFQWNPGLASSFNNSLTVTLSTCGSGNTGTLDLQVSIQ